MSSRPLVVVGFGAPARHTIVPANVVSHYAGLNGGPPSQYALAPTKLEHHNCKILVIMNSCIKPIIRVAHESTDSKVCAYYAPGDHIDVPHASQPKSISMRGSCNYSAVQLLWRRPYTLRVGRSVPTCYVILKVPLSTRTHS